MVALNCLVVALNFTSNLPLLVSDGPFSERDCLCWSSGLPGSAVVRPQEGIWVHLLTDNVMITPELLACENYEACLLSTGNTTITTTSSTTTTTDTQAIRCKTQAIPPKRPINHKQSGAKHKQGPRLLCVLLTGDR